MSEKVLQSNTGRKIIKWMGIVLLVLMVLIGGVALWAILSTDTSVIARGILWGDSDVGDLYRFPTRSWLALPWMMQ